MTHPLTKLQEDLDEHIKKEEDRWDQFTKLLTAIEALAETQKEHSRKLDEMKESFEAWTEIHKTAKGMQKLVIWLGGFGITGVMISDFLHKFFGGK